MEDDAYQALIDEVAAALVAGDVAVARRLVIRARSAAEDDVDLAVAAGLELACAAVDDEATAMARLVEHEADHGEPEAATVLGCAISDVGDALDDARVLAVAERWLGALAGRHPDAITLANHGEVLSRLDRDDEALAAFERAVELDPTLDDLHRRIGVIARQGGDPERAVRGYRAYLANHPDDAHEWISLAIVECDAGRYPEAEQAYWRAAGLEPQNLSLHYNWFVSARRYGDAERASYVLRRMQEIDPSDWRPRLAAAWTIEDDDPGAAFLGVEAALHDVEDPSHASVLAAAGLRIASQHRLTAEASRLADQVFDGWIFGADVLHLLRADEAPVPVDDFLVEVDGRYPARDPACAAIVRLRVYARGPDEASRLAEAFERRCGADAVIVTEVSATGDEAGERIPGVWWRSGASMYPIDQHGTE